MIDQSVGLIAHLPLNAILKGEQGVEFQLVTVDLERGRVAAETLRHLHDLDLADNFTIVEPALATGGVIPKDQAYTISESDSPPFVVPKVAHLAPPTLDELRERVADWSPADKQALRDELEDRDRSDPEIVLDAILTIEGFHNIKSTPAVRPATEPATPVVQLPTNPDEGPDVADEGTYKALEARYMALDVAGKQWITGITKQAAAAGTPISMGAESGRRTVRRWEILRGLVALADGFDNDDALRGCIGAAIGYELADSMAFNHGQLVGCMGHQEAWLFAVHATRLVEGLASMSFDDNGRCRVAA